MVRIAAVTCRFFCFTAPLDIKLEQGSIGSKFPIDYKISQDKDCLSFYLLAYKILPAVLQVPVFCLSAFFQLDKYTADD